ncbi:MAG: hypothetical protein ACK4N4_05920 [Burkholderiales bacterium]
MNAHTMRKLLAALLVCCAAGTAYAKLPPPSEEAKAKAAEAKAKADEAAKKQAELLGKAQDRVAERYKKEKGIKGGAASAEVKKSK